MPNCDSRGIQYYCVRATTLSIHPHADLQVKDIQYCQWIRLETKFRNVSHDYTVLLKDRSNSVQLAIINLMVFLLLKELCLIMKATVV